MKLGSLAVILLCAVSAFAGTFTSTAGRFSADFIGTPTVETQDVKTADDKTVTTTRFFSTDGQLGEVVEYTDFPSVTEFTSKQLIDTAKASFDGRTLDGVGKTESDGRTWILAAGHDDKLEYFCAITGVGIRLYEVTIAVPLVDEEKAKEAEVRAEAFLGSVKITK